MKMSRSMKNKKKSARSPLSVIPKRLHRDDQDLFGIQRPRNSGHRVKSSKLRSDRRLPSTSPSRISTEGNFSRLVHIREPASPERDFRRPSIDRKIRVTSERDFHKTSIDQEVRVTSERDFRRPSIDREVRVTGSERDFRRPSIDREVRVTSERDFHKTSFDQEVRVTSERDFRRPSIDREVRVTGSERDFRRPSIDREVRVTSFEGGIRSSRGRDLRSRSTERHIRRTCLDRGSRRSSHDRNFVRPSHERDSWRNSWRRTSRDREFTRTFHDGDFRKSSQEGYLRINERDGDFGHFSSEREFSSSFPSYPLSPDRGSQDLNRNSPIYYDFREQDSFQQRVSRSISPHIQPSEYLEENNSLFRNFDNSEVNYKSDHDLPVQRNHTGFFSEAEEYTQRRSWDSHLAEGSHYDSSSPPQEQELPSPEWQHFNDLREERLTSDIIESFCTNSQNFCRFSENHYSPERKRDVLHDRYDTSIFPEKHSSGVEEGYRSQNTAVGQPLQNARNNKNINASKVKNNLAKRRRKGPCRPKLNGIQHKYFKYYISLGYSLQDSYRLCMKPIPESTLRETSDGSIRWVHPTETISVEGNKHDPANDVIPRLKLTGAQRRRLNWYVHQGYSLQESYNFCLKPFPDVLLENKAQKQFIC